jgi:hypothetical protein
MDYKVKTPIKYDGKRREIDEVVEIEARHAKPLRKSGAIAAVKQSDRDDEERKRREAHENRQLLDLLDQTITTITEVIKQRDDQGNPVLSVEHLKALRQAEQNGKTRTGVIAAVDAEIEARLAP